MLDHCDNAISDLFNSKSYSKDIALLSLVYWIERQRPLLSKFDKTYNKSSVDLLDEFSLLILGYINKEKQDSDVIKFRGKITEYIPDTEDYGEDEAAAAQSAIISMDYCIDFLIGSKFDSFKYGFSKVIENVDLVEYLKDPHYNEDEVDIGNANIFKLIVEDIHLPTNSIDRSIINGGMIYFP